MCWVFNPTYFCFVNPNRSFPHQYIDCKSNPIISQPQRNDVGIPFPYNFMVV
ncbi:hypothetical protein SAMN02746062_01604 [Alysiella filiformis DSM 16848]|uniref:Uncharacterized protein n=1 Tax=Alysiella filiformis DSM 16848 TaxID=1120981 RepID=A0A286EEM5_9NEIS|nr:hypothetical protein SAMN02746062_01604 [Alysiella filiformis DSM 16848]